jgi:membrane fusion protein (multidrug efflux system)
MSTSMTAREIVQERPAASLRPMLTRRGLAALLTATTVSGGAWFGHDWWTRGRFVETTDDAYVGGNVTSISPTSPASSPRSPSRTTSASPPAKC